MKPLILITNDDGVLSPGLLASAEAASAFGDVLVVAPRVQQTGMGRSFPRFDDLGKIDIVPAIIGGKEVETYAVYGSPATACAYGIMEIAPRKPDLCISGINYGENVGLNISCSGTLGAAFEADSHNIPAIAFSREVPHEMQHMHELPVLNWENEIEIERKILKTIFENGMGENVCVWNINIPENATVETEIRITRQARQSCFIFDRPPKRDWNSGYRLPSRFELLGEMKPDEDVYAIYKDKVISATPLTWDMTVSMQGHHFYK